MQRASHRGPLGALALALGLGAVGLQGPAPALAQPAPAAVSAPQVAGQWTSTFAGGINNLSLQQRQAFVTGIYTSNASMPGAMAGRFTGNVLSGRWTDATSSGQFVLVFSADGRSFAGTWGRTLASATNGGPWTGSRQ